MANQIGYWSRLKTVTSTASDIPDILEMNSHPVNQKNFCNLKHLNGYVKKSVLQDVFCSLLIVHVVTEEVLTDIGPQFISHTF